MTHLSLCAFSSLIILLFASFGHAKPTRIVISGGPGFGKSSILTNLELKGARVVHEAAAALISHQKATGIKEPNLEPFFDENIAKLLLRREERETDDGTVFQDRSLIDVLAYLKFYGNSFSPEFKALVNNLGLKSRYYNTVFFVETLNKDTRNEIRKEGPTDAAKLDLELRKTYEEYGYQIVDVKMGDVGSRANAIVNHLPSELRSSWVPILDIF